MRFSPKTQLAPLGDQSTSLAETLEMDRRIGRFTPGRPSSTYRRRYAQVEGGSPDASAFPGTNLKLSHNRTWGSSGRVTPRFDTTRAPWRRLGSPAGRSSLRSFTIVAR